MLQLLCRKGKMRLARQAGVHGLSNSADRRDAEYRDNTGPDVQAPPRLGNRPKSISRSGLLQAFSPRSQRRIAQKHEGEYDPSCSRLRKTMTVSVNRV